MYLYLPNGQEKVIKYEDYSSRFRLWYPELASINVRYFTPGSLGKILFNVDLPSPGLISILLILARSKHRLTLLFAIGPVQSCCNICMSHPHLVGILFAAFVIYLAPLLGTAAVYMPPFLGVPDTVGCHLLSAN